MVNLNIYFRNVLSFQSTQVTINMEVMSTTFITTYELWYCSQGEGVSYQGGEWVTKVERVSFQGGGSEFPKWREWVTKVEELSFQGRGSELQRWRENFKIRIKYYYSHRSLGKYIISRSLCIYFSWYILSNSLITWQDAKSGLTRWEATRRPSVPTAPRQTTAPPA